MPMYISAKMLNSFVFTSFGVDPQGSGQNQFIGVSSIRTASFGISNTFGIALQFLFFTSMKNQLPFRHIEIYQENRRVYKDLKRMNDLSPLIEKYGDHEILSWHELISFDVSGPGLYRGDVYFVFSEDDLISKEFDYFQGHGQFFIYLPEIDSDKRPSLEYSQVDLDRIWNQILSIENEVGEIYDFIDLSPSSEFYEDVKKLRNKQSGLLRIIVDNETDESKIKWAKDRLDSNSKDPYY